MQQIADFYAPSTRLSYELLLWRLVQAASKVHSTFAYVRARIYSKLISLGTVDLATEVFLLEALILPVCISEAGSGCYEVAATCAASPPGSPPGAQLFAPLQRVSVHDSSILVVPFV